MLSYPCPICGNTDTVRADFDQQYCGSCDLYWHFWMKPEEIDREVQEHLKKRASG
mgnify:FL=1